tara:strand:+ start:670 stop:1107 length:438 start_codon:yes stop_codon:yes gene_type:complete
MTPCRLIYRSIANPSTLDEKSLVNLENQSANHNRRLGICGLLLLSGDRFLQVLEGTSKFVNQVYGKIIQDVRHHDVNLLSYEEIVKPEFIEWDMKLVDLGTLDAQVQKLFREKYPVNNNLFLFNDDAFLMTSLLVDMRHAQSKAK